MIGKNVKNWRTRLSLPVQITALMSSLFFGLGLSSFTPATAQTVEPMRDSATVIMYHRFGEGRYPSTNISMEMFEEHLALLTNGDYTILPLPKIVETLKSGQLLPDRTVGISIDDAYLSVYELSLIHISEPTRPY